MPFALPAASLVVNSDGTYTFTVLTAMNQGPNGSDGEEGTLDAEENLLELPVIAITGVDGDGDPVDVPLHISVQDDIPALTVGSDTIVVDEDGLAGANADAGRTGEVVGTGFVTAHGNLADNFNFGEDGAAAQAIYSVNGVTATEGRIIIDTTGYKLDVTAATGEYTFTLKAPVNSGDVQGENLADNAFRAQSECGGPRWRRRPRQRSGDAERRCAGRHPGRGQ